MIRETWQGIHNLFSRRRAQREVQDELDSYFEAAVQEKIARGVPEPEARRQVRLENGSTDAVRDEIHGARWESLVEGVFRDVRFAGRVLGKNVGVTAIAVLTLALGIGATTAVYSVVRGVLLRPFPFPKQDELLLIWQKGTDSKPSNVGFATFDDWRRLNHSFSSMSAASFWTPTLVGPREAENLSGFRVSAGTFGMLGVRMELGRDFVREEDVQGKSTVVILTHALWQRRFGRDPNIVGKTVQLGSKLYNVVGVLA